MKDPNESFLRVCESGNSILESEKDVNVIEDYEEMDLKEFDLDEAEERE